MATKGLTKDIPVAKGKPKKGHIAISEVVKRTGHARETILTMCNKGVLKATRFGGWPGRIYIDRLSLDAAATAGKMKPLARVARKKPKKRKAKVKKKATRLGGRVVASGKAKDVPKPTRVRPRNKPQANGDFRRAVAACLILKKNWQPEEVKSFLDEVEEFDAMLFNIG
jgi:hypothetical protein